METKMHCSESSCSRTLMTWNNTSAEWKRWASTGTKHRTEKKRKWEDSFRGRDQVDHALLAAAATDGTWDAAASLRLCLPLPQQPAGWAPRRLLVERTEVPEHRHNHAGRRTKQEVQGQGPRVRSPLDEQSSECRRTVSNIQPCRGTPTVYCRTFSHSTPAGAEGVTLGNERMGTRVNRERKMRTLVIIAVFAHQREFLAHMVHLRQRTHDHQDHRRRKRKPYKHRCNRTPTREDTLSEC